MEGKTTLIFAEESYQLVGLAYSVYNEMRYGHHERNYQRAFKIELDKAAVPYKKELMVPVTHKGIQVGKYYLDFLVWDKIVIELKVGNDFHSSHIKQVLTYLRSTKKRLGIIFLFSPHGLRFRRIVL